VKSGEWIASATAALLADAKLAPELCLVYLPSLDYDLQRYGPAEPRSQRALASTLAQLERMLAASHASGYDVLIFGDYAIGPVTGGPVYPNRALLEAGLLATRTVKGRLYPDFHRSRAFAMVDHEIAHVYVPNRDDLEPVRKALQSLPGVEHVLEHDKVGHPRSGELVLVAREGFFFVYPWWSDSRRAPDYATHVDIHNKPGYDPCELFFGRFPWQTGQDPRRIKGSHGRTGPARRACWAATFDLGQPSSLIELAAALRRHLEASA
jgi:predicted AlkP superfamily pyrophosphatase or phosphodiesterase